MEMRIPAEVFPPGEFLKDELDAREWTQQELAEIMRRPPRVISEIVQGKRSITPETALGLAAALGTSADMWMNLESQWALSRARIESDDVQRRAALHDAFPVREMMRRGWLRQVDDVGELEIQVSRFYEEFAANDQREEFACAARRTDVSDSAKRLQLAWLLKCRWMAREQLVPKFSADRLRASLVQLHGLLLEPEQVRSAPRIIQDCGVRLVMVEALPGSRIDGACFWLSGDKPVIALSLRLDRIDSFWFVLRHEIEHVLRGDGKTKLGILDQDVGEGEEDDPAEIAANVAGAQFSIPKGEIQDFIARVSPYISEKKVLSFAYRLKVHPGFVVGQLQRALDRHDLLRKHLAKVRQIAVSAGDVDGWGSNNTSGYFR